MFFNNSRPSLSFHVGICCPWSCYFILTTKKWFLINVVRIELRSNLYYYAFFCNAILLIGWVSADIISYSICLSNMSFVKLELLDFLYFFQSSFHALLQLKSTMSGYSFNSYYLYVKCLLWADVDCVYVTVGMEKTGASAHSIDVVHCSWTGDRATLKTTDIVQKKWTLCAAAGARSVRMWIVAAESLV